ncbi:MAG: transaldolase, partial [Solirubrobacteraceae bacterium]
MKATAQLQELGQSLWLDNITREMLDSGQLQRYIDEFSISGLTSNPSIFDKAIKSGAYDDEIRHKAAAAGDRETLFFELAIEDLRRAADLFAPIHQRTAGVDGWVSLEVSPLLAYDTARSIRSAADLHARAGRENVFIKIPGTERGLAAIEEATFAGVPVNITLLFSREQYLASAYAYMRGIERRIEAGLDPNVPSVASVFISRWDAAVIGRVPDHLRGRLGLAVGLKTYQAYRRLMDSNRWQRLANAGARTQRLLWASTSTKDPESPDTMYIDGLRAPHTINTMPESTLQAFADHGQVGEPIATDGGDAEATL